MKKSSRRISVILLMLLSLPVIITGYIIGIINSGKAILDASSESLTSEQSPDAEADRKAELQAYIDSLYAENPDVDVSYLADADLIYKGDAYKYKEGLVNLLFLGIDKNSGVEGRHQSDAIYLAVFDSKNKKVSIIAISRNTVTDVEIYNDLGEITGIDKLQLCLAYAYAGNDDMKASALTAKAVSRLLYGIPINGFYTVCMNEIFDIIDMVGGVTVTVNEDMLDISPEYTEGATVTLDSKTVLKYLRWRTEENSGRIARHKIFITACIDKLRSSTVSDPGLPLRLYNEIASKSITNLTYESVVYLLTSVIDADFSGFIDVPSQRGEYLSFEAQFPDEEALYDTVIKTFYDKQ